MNTMTATLPVVISTPHVIAITSASFEPFLSLLSLLSTVVSKDSSYRVPRAAPFVAYTSYGIILRNGPCKIRKDIKM